MIHKPIYEPKARAREYGDLAINIYTGCNHVGGRDMNDTLLHSRICEGKRFIYSVCEDGAVLRTSRKYYAESRAAVYLKDGTATVKINGKQYALKNLVAKHFIKRYRQGDYVETIDGNPFNCSVGNLNIYTKSEHGKRTGGLSRAKKVVANGVEYRSVRECANALFVSHQTLLDYMNGKVKNSVLSGIEITRAENQ